MSVFSNLKPKANLSRNAFDLSRRDVFSAKASMLVPAFIQDTIPDGVYDVKQLSLVRVDSMQTASFARMSQNTEYFFVPYSQIFRDFEQFYYERGESQRNVGNVSSQGVASLLPRFSAGVLYDKIGIGYCILRIWEYLKPNLTPWQEQRIQYLLSTNYDEYFDVHGRLCIEDQIRTLDMLGYGNFLPVIKFFYEAALSDEVTPGEGETAFFGYIDELELYIDTHPDQTSLLNPWTDADFMSKLTDCLNAFDSAEIKSLSDSKTYTWADFVSQYNTKYFSVLRIAAWLKVWSDFYRNSQYDVETNYAYYFNYDYVVSNALGTIDVAKVLECLKPRYRQYKKDVFTGSYPTAQFGSVAVAATNNPVSIKNLSTDTLTTTQRAGVLASDGSLLIRKDNNSSLANSEKWSIDSSVSALSIRQALAFQKYKESVLRAGNRTKALQTAIFGDSSRYVSDEYVDFIGAVSSPIDFNTVAATAESDTQNVAQLSSNGISTLNKNSFKYHSHDFGLLIGAFYILSESEYNSYMIDPMNRKLESFDFYKPHFQNLGLDPVFSVDNNFYPQLLASDDTVSISVLGYLAKYFEYKTAIDKVHGEFYNSLPFEFSKKIQASQSMLSLQKGAFTGFVTPRSPQQFTSIDISSLYARPDDVDDIFYASSDEHQLSDQFKVNMNHEVGAILPMSVIGLPV